MKIDLKAARKQAGEKVKYSGQLEIDSNQLIDRKPLSLLSYEIACEYFDEKLFFYGQGNIKCSCLCYRCGKATEYNLQIDFTDEINLCENDYVIIDEKFPLDNFIVDKVILSQPTKVLCSSDCAGLCDRCGTNLNVSKCTCFDENDEDNPFYSLKNNVDKNRLK